MVLMDNETSTAQKLSITEKDEVDGSVISRIRRHRGVKVTGKYIPPSEWEKIDIAHFASSMEHSNFEKIYDNMENFPTTSCQTSDMSTKPLLQDEGQSYSHTNIKKEDTSKMEQENQSVDSVLMKSPQTTSSKNTEDTSQEKVKDKTSDKHLLHFGSAMPKETLEELKNILKESPLIISKNKFNPEHSTYIAHVKLPKYGENVIKSGLTFETFRPNVEKHIRKLHLLKNPEAIQPEETTTDEISTRSQESQEEKETVQPVHINKSLSHDKSNTATGIHFDLDAGDVTDFRQFTNKDLYSCGSGIQSSLHFLSHVEHIQQQIAREDIRFVRFEAADLHGVSRSKTIPARFFHEKAISGVYMPRSYLELTTNPKDDEVDHINVSPFNSDIILKPDIKTYRILPWADKTGRVICDSYTALGDPLLTSPRYISKQLLNQLQTSGFSLCAAFTYELCIFGVAEIINSKTSLAFPAAALLTDHDQLFMQELFDGMYYTGGSIESFSSSHRPGQMEVSFQPEYGLICADNAFTFRTGIKEVAKKHGYIASFYTGNEGFCNLGLLSHSLWDVNGAKNLFYNESQVQELTDIGQKWLSGLLYHSAALSCLVAPGIACRKHFLKDAKDSQESISATWGYNDNSTAYNIKCHGHNGTYIENKLGSATANPYLALAATIAAGLDGIKRNLDLSDGRNSSSGLHHLKPSSIPLKMEDALLALEEDKYMREALGEAFIQYFIAMKRYELETEEEDTERNRFLEYFI